MLVTVQFALLVGLLGGDVPLQQAPMARLTISFTTSESQTTEPSPGEVVLRARTPAGEEFVEEGNVHLPGAASFMLRTGLVWSVSLHSKEYWGPGRSLLLASDSELAIGLVPVGTVRARIADDPALARAEITIWCWTSEDQPYLPGAALVAGDPCERHGVLVTCRVPAGLLDLRLGNRGFVPVYYWARRVEPRGTIDIGRLEFRRGGSLAGWCQGLPKGQRGGVELVPSEVGSGDPREINRSLRRSFSTPISERGFFQFSGVPVGDFDVRAQAEGLVSGRLHVRVVEGLETKVTEVLTLQPPASLAVTVVPALDPIGRSWQVDLLSSPGERTRPKDWISGEVSKDGSWAAKGLSPGRFLLAVKDADGNQWSARVIEVEGAATESVTLSAIEVEGRLARRGEAVAGSVAFHEISGPRDFRMDANLEGRFSGVLPEEGRWAVEIETGAARLSYGEVEVKLAPGATRARVVINLDGTVLRGVVVDSQERPVSGATVSVLEAYGPPVGSAASGDDGSFEILGIPPGNYSASAEVADRQSEPIPVVVMQEREASVRIVLGEARRIRGTVSSPWGPVAGATIVGLPRGGGASTWIRVLRATTSVDGTFELSVPSGVVGADVVVVPPGMASRLVVLQASEQPTIIPVGGDAGNLVLSGETRGRFLVHEQASLPAALALGTVPKPAWMTAKAHAEPAAMEPGRYGLCTAPLGGGTCVWGVLTPGSQLTLDSPKPPASPNPEPGGK